MRFECNAQLLSDGLSNVTRALPQKSKTPLMDGVRITTGEDEITLLCTDGSLSIRTTVEARVSEPGEVVLPGKLFAEMISKLPVGSVSVSINDRQVAAIRFGSSRSTLAGMPALDFPEMKELLDAYAIHLPQKRLREMIARVLFAISLQEARQVLTGCLLEVTRDELRLVTMDGFRLAMQQERNDFILPDGVSILKAIIPGRVVGEMNRIMTDSDDMVTFHISNAHLQARIGNTTLVTSLLVGEYINYRKILPSEWLTRVVVQRAAFLDAVDRASLMAREGKNNLVRMSASQAEQKLTITSVSEMGDVFEELDVHADGKDIDIAFNARYIIDVLKIIDDETTVLATNTPVSPAVILPTSGSGYLYLVLPVRVN